ncbi:hypothetical protein HPB50_018683 [Hyalomma asiaticum]|uniref:Uncharacterized protein n=1 Tax=Hyalomma asiaticum TaxID=266040 RepID=A0ACB7SFD9_HYAAI|nr:hypothetical protein HPB50_018683 [Hyalomma asiaticum]
MLNVPPGPLITAMVSPGFIDFSKGEDADESRPALPESLETIPKADYLPTQRHRWNTNEDPRGQAISRGTRRFSSQRSRNRSSTLLQHTNVSSLPLFEGDDGDRCKAVSFIGYLETAAVTEAPQRSTHRPSEGLAGRCRRRRRRA